MMANNTVRYCIRQQETGLYYPKGILMTYNDSEALSFSSYDEADDWRHDNPNTKVTNEIVKFTITVEVM